MASFMIVNLMLALGTGGGNWYGYPHVHFVKR